MFGHINLQVSFETSRGPQNLLNAGRMQPKNRSLGSLVLNKQDHCAIEYIVQ